MDKVSELDRLLRNNICADGDSNCMGCIDQNKPRCIVTQTKRSLLTLLIDRLEKEKSNLKEAEKMRQSCINAVKGMFGEGVK
jgi:hypothetical protein